MDLSGKTENHPYRPHTIEAFVRYIANGMNTPLVPFSVWFQANNCRVCFRMMADFVMGTFVLSFQLTTDADNLDLTRE